jgi:hypothetical protein
MDRVRFGRALGFGARQAVKTIMTAANAATADSPTAAAPSTKSSPAASGPAPAPAPFQPEIQSPSRPRPASPTRVPSSPPKVADIAGTVFKAASQAHEAHRQAQQQVRNEVHRVAKKGVRQGATQFKEAAWKPFVRLSGVLWLEVTGVFFGIFALFAFGGIMRFRSAWHTTAANADTHRRLLVAIVMFVVFGYFCVSSFVRAHRRERRR